MEDRRFGHLENVGTVQRRTVIARIGGREADLVVDHDVYRATHAVTTRLTKVQSFLVDPLTSNGGIPVDQHREHFILAVFTTPTLT